MLKPPVTSTLPLGNNEAVWKLRAVLIDPVAVQVPVAGLKSSALVESLALYPPAARTVPLGNSVSMRLLRAVLIAPVVGVQLPVAGSYISELVKDDPLVPIPPVTRTLPLGRRVAAAE